MKYVVNTRGGAKQVPDQTLAQLLSQGYIEITKKQFEDKPYYPEHDKGSSYQAKTTTPAQLPSKANSKKIQSFRTRIV